MCQKISQFEIFHEVRRNFPITFSTNPLAKTKKTWGHLFDEIEAGRGGCSGPRTKLAVECVDMISKCSN